MSDKDLRRGVRAILSGAAVGLDDETIGELVVALHRVTGDRFHVEHVAACESVVGKEPFWYRTWDGWCLHLALEITHESGSQRVEARLGCSKKDHPAGEHLRNEIALGPRPNYQTCKRCAARAVRMGISRNARASMEPVA